MGFRIWMQASQCTPRCLLLTLTASWNIECGEVVVTIESLILRQGDTVGSQVRNIHTKHGAGDDAKVATNVKRYGYDL